MGRPYAIAAVAKLTGLSTDTLRAWERRYRVITPQRDAKGMRRYGETDVARLQLLRSATSIGHAIRHVAKLPDDEIKALVRQPPQPGADFGGPIVQKVLQSIRGYDVWRAEELLANAAMLSKPQDFVLNVLAPLMATVGSLWEQRALSIAQEHLVSVLVRNLVGSMMRLRPPATGGTMLFATPPGEPHEFGIALAACLASMRGIRPCVLGTNVPAHEVLRAARRLRPDTIVFGATLGEHGMAQYLASVRAKLPARMQTWVGGEAAQSVSIEETGVEPIATLAHFCDRLGRELQ